MPSTSLAVQMFTVREYMKTALDAVRTFRKLKSQGWEAVQTNPPGFFEPEALKRVLADEGLNLCGTHTGFERVRDETEAVIDEQLLWQCKYVTISSMPVEYSGEGTEGFQRFAREASEIAHRLEDQGLTLCYHNHSFEFERFGAKRGLEILFEESDPDGLQFEIDTYWVQHGGCDPVAWLRKGKGRADLVHLKDMAMRGSEQLFAEVGEGNLDWSGILDACREAGTKWHIVEQDRCQRDPFESLEISLGNLHALGLK